MVLYPSSVEVDCGCIGLVEFGTPVFGRPFVASVEVVLVGFVEFGTPVFSRPFVLPRWRLYWLREEFGTPGCICKILGGSPRWTS